MDDVCPVCGGFKVVDLGIWREFHACACDNKFVLLVLNKLAKEQKQDNWDRLVDDLNQHKSTLGDIVDECASRCVELSRLSLLEKIDKMQDCLDDKSISLRALRCFLQEKEGEEK